MGKRLASSPPKNTARTFFRSALILTLLLVILAAPVFSQEDKENSEFKLAVNLYNDGMLDLALQQLKNFIDAYPSGANSTEARFYLGLTQMKLKKYDEARFTFQNFALTYIDDPKAPQAWMKVAEAFTAMHNTLEAASAYERVKTFYPKNTLVPDALLSAAKLYYASGETDHAIKLLRTILEDYPKGAHGPEARLLLAEIYLASDQTDLAEQEATRIKDSNAPDSIAASAVYLLGTLKFDAALFDDAEKMFASITAAYPHTSGAVDAAFAVASLQRAKMDFKNASTQYQSVLSSRASDSLKAAAKYSLGEIAFAQKDYSAALNYYEQLLNDSTATSINPNRLLYQAGKSTFEGGQYEQAIQYFKRIIAAKENPEQRRAMVRIAEAYVHLNNFNEAASSYAAYLERYPAGDGAPEITFRLGKIYQDELKDYRKAASTYAELVRKYPRSSFAPQALIGEANCDESLDNYEEAAAIYSMELRTYPSYPGSDTVQQRVAFLENHKIQNRDHALEKLSRLMGDLLLDKSKPQLSMELAEVYYHDLKDYRSAATQYSNALEKNVNEADFITAYFNRARAFHLLSEIDSTVRDQAIIYYESFVKQFPTDSLSGNARYYALRLKADKKSPAETETGLKELLSAPLLRENKEEALYLLSTTGIAPSNIAEKIVYTSQLAREFPISSLAQSALWTIGSWYSDQQHPDTALMYWKRATDSIPNGYSTAKILWESSQLHLRLKMYSAALADFDRLISSYSYAPEATQAHDAYGDVLLSAAKYKDAVAFFEKEITHYENSLSEDGPFPDLLFSLAVACDKSGQAERAVRGYTAYLLKNLVGTHSAEAFYALGVTARSRGESDIAAAYFKEAAEHGGAAGATEEIADMLFQNEQYDEAAKQYLQLEQNGADAGHKERYLHQAIISELRNDQFASAQKLIERYQNLYKAQMDAHHDIQAEFSFETGLYYYRQQSYTKANPVFKKITDDYSDTKFCPRALYYTGKILELSNNLQEAAKIYLDILDKYPTSDIRPHVMLSLGNMHYNAERYEDAIKYYQMIVDMGDSSGDALSFAMNNLIQAYESTKLYDAALKVTKDYIAKFPTDENLIDKKIEIGLLYTKLGYYDQAVLHFQNLINEAGSLLEAELRYNIGDAYFQKGDYQQAILEFLKVPYLVSRQGKVNWTATSLYMAGQCYEKMSKFDQAIEMYKQIVDRDGIDATFKAAAKKEIERVNTITKQ